MGRRARFFIFLFLGIFPVSGFGSTCAMTLAELAALAKRVKRLDPGDVAPNEAAKQVVVRVLRALYGMEGKAPSRFLEGSIDSVGNAEEATRPPVVRGRLLGLVGDAMLPLQYLEDVQDETMKDRLYGDLLQTGLSTWEAEKRAKDPGFLPETVGQIVNGVARAAERKELQPLLSFLRNYYEEALAAASLRNAVDELQWKLLGLVVEGAYTDGSKLRRRWPIEWFADLFREWKPRPDHYLADPRDPAALAAKRLLVRMARAAGTPLTDEDFSAFEGLASRWDRRIPSRELQRQISEVLEALRTRQRALVDARARFYRMYRAARVFQKVAGDMACGAPERPIESYNPLRQILDLSLAGHPYARAWIREYLKEAGSLYHPFLCKTQPVPEDLNGVTDPVLAAQILTPSVLAELFDESRTAGLTAQLAEADRRRYDAAVREWVSIGHRSTRNVLEQLLRTRAAKDPLYETLIGPALAPILDKWRAEYPADGRVRRRPLPFVDTTVYRRLAEQGAAKPALALPDLVARIQAYLGPDNVRMNWDLFPTELKDRLAEIGVTSPRRRLMDDTDPDEEKEEELYPPVDWYPDTDGAARFEKSYAWVNKVFEILDERARQIALRDQRGPTDRDPERNALVDTLIDVEHAIEGSLLAAAMEKRIELSDENAQTEALRVVVFYLRKFANLRVFVVGHAAHDPVLRELWVRLFLRMAQGHLDLPRAVRPEPTPPTPPSDNKPPVPAPSGPVQPPGGVSPAIVVTPAAVALAALLPNARTAQVWGKRALWVLGGGVVLGAVMWIYSQFTPHHEIVPGPQPPPPIVEPNRR